MLSLICECELTYSQFRTNFTFREVRKMLQLEADTKYRRGEYMFISRATVLGRWHEIKLRLWKEFQEGLNQFGCSRKCHG